MPSTEYACNELFTAYTEFDLEPVVAEIYEGTNKASYKCLRSVRTQAGPRARYVWRVCSSGVALKHETNAGTERAAYKACVRCVHSSGVASVFEICEDTGKASCKCVRSMRAQTRPRASYGVASVFEICEDTGEAKCKIYECVALVRRCSARPARAQTWPHSRSEWDVCAALVRHCFVRSMRTQQGGVQGACDACVALLWHCYTRSMRAETRPCEKH
eukprot:1157829-Pelagomonas_calceolata.AAC.8